MTTVEKIKKLTANMKTIEKFQKSLSKSDYKIIKCYEYSLVGLEAPYDAEKLHEQREKIREEIRRLEKE